MGTIRYKYKGGVHLPEMKGTSDVTIVKMNIPGKVVLPMIQHTGVPCEPLVKKGDMVKVGQVIGDTDKYMSAPIHSSVSGIVTEVGPALYPGGGKVVSIGIETDGLQTVHESVTPHEFSGKKEFLDLVRASGLVGLGGAGFPTHVKLNPPDGKEINTLVINGAECEPYITSDCRAMIENSYNILAGIDIVKTELGIEKVYIGVEDNKPEAIDVLTRIAEKDDDIDVVPLKSLYPQGAEKMLIYSCTGRRVPPGKLPMDVGVVVMNVNGAALIAEYIKTGMPLVKKTVTVAGSAVREPMNVEAPIGALLKDVFEFCGGLSDEVGKILMGGPMMGIAQHSLEVPVIKNTNALLAFTREEALLDKETSCIRCGRCVESCPMSLMPLNINSAALKTDIDRLNTYNVMDCIECGACMFRCPAKRRIVQSARLGKSILREAMKATS